MIEEIEKLLNEGISVHDVAERLKIPMEEVILKMSDERKPAPKTLMAGDFSLFLVISDEGCFLVCGNDFTLEAMRNRWNNSKFHLLGLAVDGVQPGIVGSMATVNSGSIARLPAL